MQIITLDLANQSECETWNEYVSKHPNGTAYHFVAWVKAVEDAYEQTPVLLAAKIDKKFVGILPSVVIANPITTMSICSLPYCDMGHILADSPEIEAKLILALQDYAAQHKIKCIDYRTCPASNVIEPSDFAQMAGKKVSMRMNLAIDSTAQMASYKSKLRSQINKSTKNGCHFKLSDGAELLDDFYQVFSRNMRDLGSPVHKKAWFAAVLNQYGTKARLGLVYIGDMPIGAGIIILHPNLCSIPWASTVADYNHLAPNMLLYANLIGLAADMGATKFDFGRSTINEGTFRFKKQWGAVPYALDWFELGHAQVDLTPSTPSKLRILAEDIWRKLPVGLTTAVGSRVRGYISL